MLQLAEDKTQNSQSTHDLGTGLVYRVLRLLAGAQSGTNKHKPPWGPGRRSPEAAARYSRGSETVIRVSTCVSGAVALLPGSILEAQFFSPLPRDDTVVTDVNGGP